MKKLLLAGVLLLGMTSCTPREKICLSEKQFTEGRFRALESSLLFGADRAREFEKLYKICD